MILKLGGSVLSDKKIPFSVNWDNLERIAMEIKKASVDDLIIVHGGGSFGHPIAKKYMKNGQFINMHKGFWEIQRAMRRFNNIIIDTLQSYDIPAVSIQPSSFVVYKGEIVFDVSAIKEFLKKKFVPVIHGDIIIGEDYKILSGDDIAPYLAKTLGLRLLYATDVDGVYVNGKVIERIDKENVEDVLKHLSGSNGIDVTGGMRYKIEMLIKNKLNAIIFNGNKRDNIYKALKGEKIGTEIILE
ncbi:aspartate/glutamate/uridylate kinase [Methanocaldococcus villosus KIN24-T80]|uniref:Isopentenyl phosphate kinase n=1 Tax=Methanocaldococcus villosus KIN24-T80 TaxID=1069083 RepID=N6UUJ3_9EURY|nr:isopentenyl phosphate kinase [Methanocaldococcus villosus]ENN96009.1 aspartate/glutamate/uridylate kinase [Methanocaldococcus villosus KIN24-T80]